MYKDVWKKFGAKVLIVLCSVLLVGGVAIAVPKLMAASRVSLNDVTFVEAGGNEPGITSGSAILTLSDPDQLYTLDGNGGVIAAIPSSLTLKYLDESGKIRTDTIQEGTDYMFADTGEEDKAKKIAPNGVEIKIKPVMGSNYLINDAANCTIKYNIKKSSLNKIATDAVQTNNPGYQGITRTVLVSSGNEAITSRNIKINVTYDGKTFFLPESEYDIYEAQKNGNSYTETNNLNPTPNALGRYAVFIKYKNFYLGNNENTVSELFEFDIKKDSSNFTIQAWSDENGTQEYLPTNVSVNPVKVQVFDGASDVSDSFEFSFPYETLPDSTTEKRVVATPKATSDYIGEVVRRWTVSEKPLDVRFRSGRPDGTLDVMDYDQAVDGYKGVQTYKIEKQPLTVKVNGTDRDLDTNRYEIISYTVVKSERDNTPIPGGTAGIIMMEIKTASNYTWAPSTTGYLYYGIRRNISNARLKDSEGDENLSDIKYNEKTHYRTPYIYFDDAPDGVEYKLVKDTDYTLAYSLKKRGDGSVLTGGNDAVTYAGTVSMTVTGKAGTGAAGTGTDMPGYYGVLTGESFPDKLAYEIQAKSINEYDMRYNDVTYQLEDTPPNIATSETNIYFSPKDTSLRTIYFNQLVSPADYSIDYYFNRACGENDYIDDWGQSVEDGDIEAGGTYYAKITFNGNYKDFVVIPLKMVAYEISNVKITVKDWCNQESEADGKHIYNGKQHSLNVVITPKDDPSRPLVQGDREGRGDYWLVYDSNSDRVNATGQSVTVTIKFKSGAETTRKLTIHSRQVESGKLKITASGFENSANGTTHLYNGTGDSKVPALDKLELTYQTAGGSSDTLTMYEQAGVQKEDGTLSNDDYDVLPGLYDANGNKVNLSTVSTSTDYYYAIKPHNNFEGISFSPDKQYVLAGPFKFTKKDLGAKEIIYRDKSTKGDLVMNQWKFTDYDKEVKEWLASHLEVWDEDLQQAVDPSNYTIDLTDSNKIDENGTIVFKITATADGCYKNEKEKLIIYTGEDIANTEVREKGTTVYHGFVNREITLDKFYTKVASTGDLYGLNFGNADDGNFTCVYFDGRNFSDIIGVDQKYTVGTFIEPVKDSSNPQKQQMGSVTLTGKNGFHGTVTIYIKVENHHFDQTHYEIRIADQIYNGKEQKPAITVWYSATGKSTANPDPQDWERLPDDCYDPNTVEWLRNVNANEIYATNGNYDTNNLSQVTIQGQFGYDGPLKGWFVIKPYDITDGTDGVDNMNINGIRFDDKSNTLQGIMYVPYTYLDSKTAAEGTTGTGDDITVEGAWKTFKLNFYPDGLSGAPVEMTKDDYSYYCTAGSAADNYDKDKKPIKAGTSYAVIKGKNNFTGTIHAQYTVNKVNMSTSCSVKFVNNRKWNLFTGKEILPEIEVIQKAENGKTYKLTEGTDYTLEYSKNKRFITNDWNNPVTCTTWIEIKEAGNGNYIEGFTEPYVIYADLDPGNGITGGSSNLKLYWGTDPKLKISYQNVKNQAFEGLNLSIQQWKEGGSFGTGTMDEDYATYQMKLGTPPASAETSDYTVEFPVQSIGGSDDNPRTMILRGLSDGVSKGVIRTSGPNGVSVPAVIYDSLENIDEDKLWENNGGSPNISLSITTGSAISHEDLSKILIIHCGGRPLVWGKDYIFEGQMNTTIGQGSILIKPTQEALDAGYLTNESKRIDYNLVSAITGMVPNIKAEYIYKHQKFFNTATTDFGLSMNGKNLINGIDYKVTVTDENGTEVPEPENCGTYNYVIVGIGSYGDRITGSFRIRPYDLGADYAQGKVTVELKNQGRITFTGSSVLPEVVRVTVKHGDYDTPFDLVLLDESNAGDYGVRTAKDKDDPVHVNWTDSDGEIPKVAVYGMNNYTGEFTANYLIEKKSIEDSNIIIDDILGLKYQNGAEIKPVPRITYKETPDENAKVLMVLSGEEYNSDKENEYGSQYRINFTYRYLDEVKNAGTKHIEIIGVGNFTGKRSITFTVDPLPLSDTKLTFLSEEVPVYDSLPQTPAFKLSYGNVDNILTVRNGKPVSTEYLKASNVEVKFEDNTDATTEEKKASVTVKIVAGSTANYEGEVTKEFSILPAPIENHVRFMYRPKGASGDADLSTYKLSFPFKGEGQPVYPKYAPADAELAEEEIGMYYNFPQKANHGKFLVPGTDVGSQDDPDGFSIEYKYVEPDTEDTDIREEYDRPTPDWAGKVRVTITGKNNYTGKASFWYFIGDDISSDAKISMTPATAVFNSLNQYPKVTISGIDENRCHISNYWKEVLVENLISNKEFINAGTYYIRIEGKPSAGTYATKPETLKFTITPRALSNSLVIDGFKKEYSYTGYEIRPVGISVTDYIDNIKYRLTEDEDYVLSYSNNLNVGIAYINVKGQGNFSGSAATNFLITSSTISSGGINGSNSFLDGGSGEISGTVPVSPNNVNLTMDTSDAMYYTGKAVYPKVSISGMTENIDYTVTFSNNVEVGIGVATINGIGNNNGVITKNFRIIAPLSKCTISPIPAQQYTGSAVTPSITVRCGNTVLMEGTDYAVSYANNINIGTATVTIRALNNANYTGTATAKFSIGNDVGGFIISGYAPSYAYTGNAITPGVVVETGSSTLTLGTDYTVSYSNNVNSGTATITVTGIGKYSGTQTANFIIEGKNIQSCDTTEVADRTYTGDAYTPDITVSDGGKVLKNGVDYTVTYTNNTNPGTASIIIQGVGSNYTGTKVISFKISAVAVKGLKASSVKYNSIKLKWTKQEYADGYQVCDSNSKVVKTVKTNSATITGLSAAKTYKYKVRSYVRNSDGTKSYGTFSSVLSTTTKLKTPTVKVVSNAKGQARISWSKVSRATGYEIYYKKSAKAKYKKLKTVNNANIRVCKVRGMNSGDRAYFRVRAFRKSGSKKIYSALNPLKVITVK